MPMTFKHCLLCLVSVFSSTGKPLARLQRHRPGSCLLQAGFAAPPLQSKVALGPVVSELQQAGNRTVKGTSLHPKLAAFSVASAGRKADAGTVPELMPEKMYDVDYPNDANAHLGNITFGSGRGNGFLPNMKNAKNKAEAVAGIPGAKSGAAHGKGGKKPSGRTESGSEAGAAGGQSSEEASEETAEESSGAGDKVEININASQEAKVEQAVQKERKAEAQANVARLSKALQAKNQALEKADKRAHLTNVQQQLAYNKLKKAMNKTALREKAYQVYTAQTHEIENKMNHLKNITKEAKYALTKASHQYADQQMEFKRKKIASIVAKKKLKKETMEEVKEKTKFMIQKAEADAAVNSLARAKYMQQAAEEELRQAQESLGQTAWGNRAVSLAPDSKSHCERNRKFIAVLLAVCVAALQSSLLL